MNHRLRAALDRAAFIDPRKPRTETVRLPHRPASAGVCRRTASETAVTLQPISVSAPRRDTAADVRAFCLDQFEPAARRLAAA